jgi:hypothetical protein
MFLGSQAVLQHCHSLSTIARRGNGSHPEPNLYRHTWTRSERPIGEALAKAPCESCANGSTTAVDADRKDGLDACRAEVYG